MTAPMFLRRCENWVCKISLATSKGSFSLFKSRVISSKRDSEFAFVVGVSVT